MKRTVFAVLAVIAVIFGGLSAGAPARASAGAPSTASIPPTDGACSAYLDGRYKAVNGYIYQCQLIPGIGFMWVLIGYVHCAPARAAAPGRCT
jgi:hypothetical protein